MPKNEGIDNDYDYLLNTMVNMGGDIDTPPREGITHHLLTYLIYAQSNRSLIFITAAVTQV
jgi:hypothetical protein